VKVKVKKVQKSKGAVETSVGKLPAAVKEVRMMKKEVRTDGTGQRH